jgi:hypothetical protein
MVVHVVLFRPKGTLSEVERRALIASIEQAAGGISTVRRFRVGRAVTSPPQYQVQGFPDLPYVAIIEFDDRAGLDEYLSHQAHGELGARFNASLEAALVYDYDVTDVASLSSLQLDVQEPEQGAQL